MSSRTNLQQLPPPPTNVGRINLLWLDRSACVEMGIDDFFVKAGHVISDESLNICRGCEVRRDCLTHAYTGLDGGPINGGYYGGISPGQRKDMTLEQALEFIDRDPPKPSRLAG